MNTRLLTFISLLLFSFSSLCAQVSNDDCADAALVPVSIFGGVPGFVPYSTDGATGSAVCEGVGDEVVWFQFVAEHTNDAIMAGVNPAFTTGFPTGFDAVIEVFDACSGNSLGCFNNYGVNELERVVIGNLVPGDTYYYSVHTSGGSASTSSNEFHTAVRTYADQALRPVYCGFDGYTLTDVIQSERDDLNELYDLPAVYVTGYAFRFMNEGNLVSEVFQPTVDGFFIQLGNVPGLEYGDNYDVSVAHRVRQSANGVITDLWSDFGASCPVKLGPFAPTTGLIDAYCDTGDEYTLGENIFAEAINGADTYKFFFSDGVNTLEKNSNNYSLHLYNVPGIQYNTTYSVTVIARVNSVWTPVGESCSLIMAEQPKAALLQGSSCGQVYDYPSGQLIFAENVSGATSYRFRFIGANGTSVFYRTSPSLVLNSVLDLQAGEYTVSVAVEVGGVVGVYGDDCSITLGETETSELAKINSPSSSSAFEDLSFVLFPNPNVGREVMLRFETETQNALANYELVDMTGKQLIQEDFSTTGGTTMYRLTFDRKLDKGMYLIHLTINGNRRMSRLIVE